MGKLGLYEYLFILLIYPCTVLCLGFVPRAVLFGSSPDPAYSHKP